jgi:hypothetical protein
MTWAQFKKAIEMSGVKDDDEFMLNVKKYKDGSIYVWRGEYKEDDTSSKENQ